MPETPEPIAVHKVALENVSDASTCAASAGGTGSATA
jgi:hypothetical protein